MLAQHKIEVIGHSPTRGATLARIVGRHPSQFIGLALLQSDNAVDSNPCEESLDHQLVEIGIGKMCRRIAILAGDGLKHIAHIGPAAFNGDVHEAGRIWHKYQRLQQSSLLEEIAATIDFADEFHMLARRQRPERPQKERRSGEHWKCPLSWRGDARLLQLCSLRSLQLRSTIA